MATQARVSRTASVIGVHASPTVRRVFTFRLSARDSLPTLEPRAGGSRAWGTVRLVVNDDDSFEYLATIYNPDGEAFTGAVVRRGAGEVLATLFSDVTLRERYIQLRGTVSIGRGARADVLAEELRENPRAFTVSVLAAGAPSLGAIRGTVE
jgi:hypothetical protein